MPDKKADSKRIAKLRREMCAAIPRVPNTRETLDALEAMTLTGLLIRYLSWQARFIPIRPRKVRLESTVTADKRWKSLSPLINALFDKARSGDDLTPFLSLRASSHGFSLATQMPVSAADKWDDKDLTLNVMGFHHLHLGPTITSAGHAERTDDVLFAKVDRQTFTAIGIFDHSVWKQQVRGMTPERHRLWKVFTERMELGMPPGTIYIPKGISTAGTPLELVQMAIGYRNSIRRIDPLLDDLSQRAKFFNDISHDRVKAMKLSWTMFGLDLGLLDSATDTFHLLHKGPI